MTLNKCIFQGKERSKDPVSREAFTDDGVWHHAVSGECGKSSQNTKILNIVQCCFLIGYIWHLKDV